MIERGKKDKKIEKGDFLFKICIFIYVYILLYMSCMYAYTCMQVLTEARRGIRFPGTSVIGSSLLGPSSSMSARTNFSPLEE